MCVRVWDFTMHVWNSEDKSVESFSPSTCVGVRNLAQDTKLILKYLPVLSHITSPVCSFLSLFSFFYIDTNYRT